MRVILEEEEREGEKMKEEKLWEVTVEQIQLKPQTRIVVSMTTDQVIDALRRRSIEERIPHMKEVK